jgi:hypothetical protein
MQRYDYDLTHNAFCSGQLGRLQTLSVIPVIANDTISLDMDIAMRLSPLRMPMTLDAKVDFCVFYHKHRFVYEEDWINLIKDGVNQESQIELGELTIDRWPNSSVEYLAGFGRQTNIKKFAIHGYNSIWNHYYRIPNVSEEIDTDFVAGEEIPSQTYHPWDTNQDSQISYEELADNYQSLSTHLRRNIQNMTANEKAQPVSQAFASQAGVPWVYEYNQNNEVTLENQMLEERRYGRRCARLPQQWNTGLPSMAYNNEEFGDVDVVNGKFNLLSVAQARGQLKTEIDRDWFNHRYRDHMQDDFGSSGVSIDADKRPELLLHDSMYLSGYDVDGTSGETFGSTTGKSAGMFNIKMPPKYFNEHGCIWIMALVRFPSILQQDRHYLSNNVLDYKTIAGDPRLIEVMPPHEYQVQDITSCDTNTTTSIGMRAYADWYRWQPNNVHKDFHDFMGNSNLFDETQGTSGNGYPFINGNTINWLNQSEISYDAHQEDGRNGYDNYFQSTRMGHWFISSIIHTDAKRIIPPASQSINAGV